MLCRASSAVKTEHASSHFYRRRLINQAMDTHNHKLHAMHRRNATGVSYLVERPGYGMELPSFERFLDFHLPPSSVTETTENRNFKVMRTSVQDRVRAGRVPFCPPELVACQPLVPGMSHDAQDCSHSLACARSSVLRSTSSAYLKAGCRAPCAS